jgi:cobalt-precorrin-5B (C1)-methyltransferase
MSALREGYTTGSCAAAGAKAAAILLLEGRTVKSVEIPLPGGRLSLPVAYARQAGDSAEAAVVKDAGDDPDVTNGALVSAAVCWIEGDDVQFAAGDGVGTVTKPGLAIPPGEPAINPVPRRMIAAALREVTPRGLRVTISIAGGAKLAQRTFNPRIGVTGGLSILGTTGIVRPFSCSALQETIRCALDVAAAAGIRAPTLVPGHIGERALRAGFSVSEEQVVEAGNLWGFALDEVLRRPFTALLAAGHPGKLAKLTAGDWDTHSGHSASALPVVAALQGRLFGRPAAGAVTVEGIFTALNGEDKKRLGDALAKAVREAVAERTQGRLRTAAVLIDLKGRILGTAGDLTPWQ